MTEARDIRFAGTDPGLMRVAVALGVELAGLNTATLPAAVASVVEAQGLPDGPDARALVASLLRGDAAELAERAKQQPARLSPGEALKRQRLQLLASALALMRYKHGPGGGMAHAAHVRPHADAARDIAGVFLDIALMEGARASELKRRAASIKHWCVTDEEAKVMITSLRAVKAPGKPHKPRRGLKRTAPIGDTGIALQDAWRP